MNTQASSFCLAASQPDSIKTGIWAVVPVKKLADAKQRLNSCLGGMRQAFTLSMLEDVFGAVTQSRRIEGFVCVTSDPTVAALAVRYNAMVVKENEERGMNEAIRLGINTACDRDGQRVVVLPGDLPLATGAEIDRLLLATEAEAVPGQPPVISLSAAAEDNGTNFLCLDASHSFETRFGINSFQRHEDHARAEGFRPLLLESSTLSFDIDNEKDLQKLISYCSHHPEFQSTRSWKFLQQNGLTDSPEHPFR